MGSNRVVLAVAAVALTLAGCSSPEPGTPTAGGGESTADTSSSEPTTKPTGPSGTSAARPSSTRPKPIPLAGVEPCSLLVLLPNAEFSLDDFPPSPSDSLAYPGSKTCSRSGGAKTNVSYVVTPVLSRGVETYGTATGAAKVVPTSIAGYPGLVISADRSPEQCNLAIDVADKQMLFVQHRNTNTPPPALDQICANLVKAAAFTMKGLGAS